jgi:sirohydrochlorin cobaltochelatase
MRANAPILLVASGTSSRAAPTYGLLEDACRARFPDRDIYWAFSSDRVRELAFERSGTVLPSPSELLDSLSESGHREVVVQPVHLICGEEFHHVVRAGRAAGPSIRLGMPLISGPDDMSAIAAVVVGSADPSPNAATLVVGHGTHHPSGMVYDLLGRHLRDRLGDRIRVGVLTGHPDIDAAISDLAAGGFRRVRLTPLMLVAGAHARRDIDGDREGSVRRRLEAKGITVETWLTGLLEEPAVVGIFCDHLVNAMASKALGNE